MSDDEQGREGLVAATIANETGLAVTLPDFRKFRTTNGIEYVEGAPLPGRKTALKITRISAPDPQEWFPLLPRVEVVCEQIGHQNGPHRQLVIGVWADGSSVEFIETIEEPEREVETQGETTSDTERAPELE